VGLSEIATTLGQQIRAIRTTKGVSMEALAEHACLSPTYVSEIERGRKEPSVQTLLKVARALNVQLSDLTAPLEAVHQAKVTKYELLGRLERSMKLFFTEEEAQRVIEQTRERPGE